MKRHVYEMTESVISDLHPSDGINTVATAITGVVTTVGPQMARQWMRYNNQTVADKVPEEMLHLIDPHWYKYILYKHHKYLYTCENIAI